MSETSEVHVWLKGCTAPIIYRCDTLEEAKQSLEEAQNQPQGWDGIRVFGALARALKHEMQLPDAGYSAIVKDARWAR